MPELPGRTQHALADRYRIVRHLGSGGMADVYLASDLRHERHVALKVLQPELASALGAERFLREIKTTAQLTHPHVLPLLDSGAADGTLFYVMPYVEGESLLDRLARERQLPLDDALQIAARLSHPNILPLHDSGEADGFLYYVMPYVPGETLRQRLEREKQLPMDDALQITREVADALSYAHSHGVIHRDIKPENILLEGAHAVVADFGIARAVSAAGGTRLTETGLAIGTPAYMSPEQASGSKDVDGRSDI